MNVEHSKYVQFIKRHASDLHVSTRSAINIHELGRGAFNINQLATFDDVRLVFRFVLWPHRLEVGSMVEYEYRVLKELESSHLTPRVLMMDDSKTIFPYPVLIEEYLEQSEARPTKHAELCRWSGHCINALQHIHTTAFQNTGALLSQEKFLSMSRFISRLEYVRPHNPALTTLFENNSQYLSKYINHCGALLTERVLLHGDPFLENFIETKNGIKIVDWQASIWADRAIDLALFIWDFGWEFYGQTLSEKEKNSLISDYCRQMGLPLDPMLQKIRTALPFLYLNMLLEVEYRYFLIQDPAFTSKIGKVDREFILNNRIGPARNMLVTMEKLRELIDSARTILSR